MEERTADVLIVGAGPTGLQMAHLLRIQNISYRIIDLKEGISTTSKALVVQPRTMEMWEDLGLLQAPLENGLKINKIRVSKDKQTIGEADFGVVPSKYPFLLIYRQSETEGMLLNELKKLDRDVIWKSELIELSQFEGGIDVKIKYPDGTIKEEKYSWVVGCDGMNSRVRDLSKIPFEGNANPNCIGIADVELDPPLAEDRICPNASKHGAFISFPMGGGIERIIASHMSLTKDDLTEDDWNKILEERCPFPRKIKKIHWNTKFFVQYRLAKQLVHTRVLLAGDAAHVHSPVGGQGMNTGLQDVYNLAWKLGLKIQSRASPTLMQSYNWERKKFALSVIHFSRGMTDLAIKENFLFSFFRSFIIKRFLRNSKISKKFVSRLAQLSYNYRGSPICHQNIAWEISKQRRYFVSGPKPGDLSPNPICTVKGQTEKTSLYDYLRGYTHTILLFGLNGHKMGEKSRQNMLRICAKIKSKLDREMRIALVVTDESHPLIGEWEGDVIFDNAKEVHRAFHCVRPALYVIRPDNYIGYRSYKTRTYLLKKYLATVFDMT